MLRLLLLLLPLFTSFSKQIIEKFQKRFPQKKFNRISAKNIKQIFAKFAKLISAGAKKSHPLVGNLSSIFLSKEIQQQKIGRRGSKINFLYHFKKGARTVFLEANY